MILKLIQIDLIWPRNILISDLRVFILEKLSQYGQPLRWAIMEVQSFDSLEENRILKIEAVVVVPSVSGK